MLTFKLTPWKLSLLCLIAGSLVNAKHGEQSPCQPNSKSPHCMHRDVHHHAQAPKPLPGVPGKAASPPKATPVVSPPAPKTSALPKDQPNPPKGAGGAGGTGGSTGTPPPAGDLPKGNAKVVIPSKDKNGNWPKTVASSTMYFDKTGGACGCFDNQDHPKGFDSQFGLPADPSTNSPAVYFAAGSESLFNPHDQSSRLGWCGSNCGQCFKLTSLGKSACDGCGKGAELGKEIIVMLNNKCPPSYPGAQGEYHYCAPQNIVNAQHTYFHFDVHSQQDPSTTHQKLGGTIEWDNPLVLYEAVKCPQNALNWYKNSCKKCPL
ncbi:RlpA-like double-psi beta-barrel-protein domain-containing protein-containing protein [Protomyces lactucae-debilis]|uniref:RlpA-like double-psi beta-barrel-protein domain-containing protein-containing protein n=1 Tax=Protomyces lactucae-debilis TaxID=2754530 RepID=A0A1Y2F7G5_PROLT|nr:RlpA-like double-psi beta-barrel-protein domain-containing protein-containing protein [Protomyces lactucae-debilis]ORY79842.1 RlpA-like double-psi beta-barrel-protein domain-containing protein-containing protein [Protomyces lactucae-debilis]